MNKPKWKRVGVLTSGGDAPGMNAAIRAVVRAGLYYGFQVFGIQRGYEGLLDGEITEMNNHSVSNIISRGGTILLTARSKEFSTPEGVARGKAMAEICRLDALVVIGGDGSFRGARDLHRLGLPVIGIPVASAPFNGLDALFSIVQMPPGIPVAAVTAGKAGGKNAALYAVSILALSDKTLAEKLFPYTGTLINKVYVFIIEAFFSILIAIHLLATKETRLAQVKKMRKALFTYEQNKFINNVLKIINDSFGNYFEGKILDSLIIFILCLVSFRVFNVTEYYLLIAAMIGITDIIPIVGPFIGAIPGGFIILITNPSKFLLYVILVVLIQQLEGNIISPKILGQHMGVSALCVLISIIVMGNIFHANPIALIISVPLFAVMVELGKMFLEHRLKKKGLPTDTAEYYRGVDNENEIDCAEHYKNRKLTYYFVHSPIKTWMDNHREKKRLRKQRREEKKISAESVTTVIPEIDEVDQQEKAVPAAREATDTDTEQHGE